jgi:very-short-patch-repair endonuclease
VGKHIPVTDEERAYVLQRYEAGAWMRDLAQELHRSPKTIHRILSDAGVEVKHRAMILPATCSPIEMRLHDALKSFGIGFTTQRKYVQGYIVDIRLNQAPVIIEADGVQHAWYDGAERDAIRDQKHSDAGFRTFRFTGSEINSDAVACIQRVIDECGLIPDENPVYDIRVKFTGPDHPNWVDDRQEYACATCGKLIIRRKAQIPARGYVYCSSDCYLKVPKPADTREKLAIAGKNRTQSQETREKTSKTLKSLERIWCEECQRDWHPIHWSRHIRKYHEGGIWRLSQIKI